MQEVFGFVKRNLSGAKRRRDGRSEDGGAGQGAAVPCPRLSTQNPGARTALRASGDAFLALDDQLDGNRLNGYVGEAVFRPELL